MMSMPTERLKVQLFTTVLAAVAAFTPRPFVSSVAMTSIAVPSAVGARRHAAALMLVVDSALRPKKGK